MESKKEKKRMYMHNRCTDREKGIKNVSEEIMAENFPNLKKETEIQVQEAHIQWNTTQP